MASKHLSMFLRRLLDVSKFGLLSESFKGFSNDCFLFSLIILILVNF